MIRIRHLLTGCALASCASVLAAQGYPQNPYPSAFGQYGATSDADQLTQELRTLAADPTNLYALINAAKLSLKLGDTDAAAALYTRAERIAPGNPQVKAGMARLLVNAQRPGEALRLFAEAAQGGANQRDFGADRALAYDLIGEQERAQREYRALLRLGPDDETTRRYALSLGISGLKDPALALLEPLNRRSDRGAWRARAFVLAMNADRSGAEKIATTMMPAGMADGLKPFFDRLPKLSAVDRAFAVHFGEVRGNATRYADARRAPQLPALSPEPNPFPPKRATVQVAAAEPITKKKRRKDKDRAAETRVAASQPYVAPLPPPPAPTATQLAALTATRLSPPPTAFGGGGGRPTVLPPPADAYRPAETRLAAALPPTVLRAAPVAATPTEAADDATDDGPDEPVAAPARAATAPVVPASTALAAVVPGTVRLQAAPTTPAPQPGFTQSITTASVTPGAVALTQPTAASPSIAQQVAQAASTPTSQVSSGIPTPLAAAALTPSPVLVTPPSDTSAGSAAIASFAPPPVTIAAPTGTSGLPAADAAAQVVTPVPTAQTVQPLPTAQTVEPLPAATVPAATNLTTAPVGTPPAPVDAKGDSVLAAIVAGIKVPETELAPATLAPAVGTGLLATQEKKAETRAVVAAAKAEAAPALPKKDARGRYVDAAGKPLLDPGGRPLGPKGAAAWLARQTDAKAEPTLRKDARGRYLDAKGKPLLDTRGRPLGEKAALAKLAARTDETTAPDTGTLKKDARGRFLDANGKPLLDTRGRPLGEKAALAKLAAQTDDAASDTKLPKRDARGRFLDAKGKPLLDARGRPLDAKAAAAKLAEAKKPADAKKPDTAKGEPARFWVQVAGGANEDTLAKEWKRVSGSTAALRGKTGWTTPLRATNRVLTGPFKSSAEAMAMVNTLKKQGVAAFMFTSDAGQKVTRLGN